MFPLMLNNNTEYFNRTLDRVRPVIWDVCITDRKGIFFKANTSYIFSRLKNMIYDFIFLTIKSWFESDLDFSPKLSQLFTRHYSIIIRKVSWALSSHFAECLIWKKSLLVIFKITLYGSPFCIPILHTGKMFLNK